MSNRRRSQTRRPVRLEVLPPVIPTRILGPELEAAFWAYVAAAVAGDDTPDCDPLVGKALAMVTVSAIEQVYEARFRMPAADAAAAVWRMISEQAAAAAGKV